MPRRDGTGPDGKGPTGRGLGGCTNNKNNTNIPRRRPGRRGA